MLTQERLRQLLEYYPDAGVFVWKRVGKRSDLVGRQAGRVNTLGYHVIKVEGPGYRAHRLAWLFVHGHWPIGQLDHINGDKSDNRITNLRLATPFQNHANRPISRNNRSGYKGVIFLSPGKWKATIYHQRKSLHLGCFDTPEKAHAAYCAATQELNGEFARTA